VSDLTTLEKRKLERILKMEGGYVLDFSNPTFREFVNETTGRDIYHDRYSTIGESKAKRLRAFWSLESNDTVSKLLVEMFQYGLEEGEIDSGPLLEGGRMIACRLSNSRCGRPNAPTARSAQASGPATENGHAPLEQARRRAALTQLEADYIDLHSMIDRNAAGLALERLLNALFDISDLKPRKPFRVTGEQIDGSFELDHEIYLIEAKWHRDRLPQQDLQVFAAKIQGKSAMTRGLFVAINGISTEAKDAITRGKQPTFFVVDGHDLMMVLQGAVLLKDFLRQRFRLLAEEGLVCVPYGEIWSGTRGASY
jgi:hypothetical protein